MYNTDFKVKYYDIERELITKYDNEPDGEYTKQDIFDVCNKLYNDELTTVFYAENIYDDKIDKGINTILDVMMKNMEFASIIEEAKSKLFLGVKDDVTPETNEDSEEKTKLELNSVHIVLIIMFSKHMFYLTHKCICQQIVSGTVDTELLVCLKNELLLFLNKQY
jgi:hypothetical protein